MIYFNLKLAFRNLLKSKMYSILIVGGFAISFAACILIVLFYHSEKSVNKGFANYKQIYRLYDVKNNTCDLNWNLYSILTKKYAEIEEVCPMEYNTGYPMTVKNDHDHTSTSIKHLISTTSNFFSMFSVDVLESLSGKPFDGNNSIVLTKDVAQKLFGKQNPLGKHVNFNNFFSGTVTAIINELPANSTFQADIILNSENEEFRLAKFCNNNICYNPTNIFLLLKDGSNIAQFTDKLNREIGSYKLNVDNIGIQNLASIYLSGLNLKSVHTKGNPKLLIIFLAIALLIMSLSITNYLNYSISVQYTKLKEIGINKTNGATWRNLLQYMFFEVTLGVLIALVVSILITMVVLPYTQVLFGKTLQVSLHDLVILAPIFLAVIATVILINSFATIYILSRFRITEFLSGFKGHRNRKQVGKQVMLTFQLTSSIALIAIVMLIFKQMNFMKHSDLGFDRESLLRIELPYKFQYTDAFEQESEKLSFVKSSTVSFGCPGMINMRMGSFNGEKPFELNSIFADKDFLKTFGVDLIKGRTFLNSDLDHACIMNEEAIKKFGWDTYLGKKFNNGRPGGYEVIGVVKDFKVKSYYYGKEPLVLIYSRNFGTNTLSLKLAPGNIVHQLNLLRMVWKKFGPYDPMKFNFYDDDFQAMYDKEEKLASSVTFFAIIAIVLTIMGILGQIIMTCIQRVKEIGIRKVNGAKVSEILAMLNADFVKWLAIAFIIACPIAWYTMHKWLQNFAYKTELSWWVFILAGIITTIIALFVVSWKSYRAATRNPVEALRYE